MPVLKAVDSLDIKYRPKKLEDLVGQDEVVNTLKGMFESGTISSRTIMLYGPAGSGKSSTARMIARYLNCTGDTLLCGKCPTCQTEKIEDHFDYHELNMANTTGVDNIRELVGQAQYLPRTNFRIFVLDEAQQCFPEYTHVMIDYDKSLSIKEIYENSNITHVLSYDLETKKIERKKIIRKLKQNFKGKLNKLYISTGGYLSSTPNHAIYNENREKIEASQLEKGMHLIQYHGEFSKYRICKHCGELVEISYSKKHNSLFHPEIYMRNGTYKPNSVMCNICNEKKSSKKQLRKHILKEHIPEKYQNRNILNSIDINMNFEELQNYCYFLETGLRRCKYCDFIGKSVQTHVLFKHGDLLRINQIKQKQSKSANKRYQTEEGKAFIKKLSSSYKGIFNPVFRGRSRKEVSVLQSEKAKKWWQNMSDEEKIQRIKTFQNAPIFSGQNKIEKFVENLNISNIQYTGEGNYYVTFTVPDCPNKDTCQKKCRHGQIHKNPDFIYLPKKCGICKFFENCEFHPLKTQDCCDKFIISSTYRTSKVIEVMDFEYWHCKLNAERIKKGYESVGITSLILDANRIRKDPENTQATIEAFINNSTDITVNKCSYSKEYNIDIYNLEIENNHNYFAVAGDYHHHNPTMKLFGEDVKPTPILVGNCTTQAKEALLKPLEEPPDHVVWILCTTEPERFKETVWGRCLKLQMKPVNPKDLAKLLYKVAKAEKSKIAEDKKSLIEIAKLVRGQPRDGLKALQKVMYYLQGKGQVDLEMLPRIIKEVVDLPPDIAICKYLLSAYSGKFATALTVVDSITNAEYFLRNTIDFHENVLKASVKPSLMVQYPAYMRLIEQIKKTDTMLPSIILGQMHHDMVITLSEMKTYAVDSKKLLIDLTCLLVERAYSYIACSSEKK